MRRTIATLIAFAAIIATAGCWRPYQQEKLVEIAPNETAFKVPLEGDSSSQEKLQSEEYLKKNQVSAKRVSIAQRWQDTGRLAGDGKWIDAERIIKVNRVPVTREWTNEDGTGTSNRDDALPLGSKDSIAFFANATLTAEIEEQNAAKFAYHWGGDLDDQRGHTERRLEQVIDTNVRSFAITELQKRFGKSMFMDCISNKEDYFQEVFVETRDEFAKVGITIRFFGLHGNLEPKNKDIQTSLDKAFITENEKKIAVNQTLMQAERNKQLVAEQEGKAQMAIAAAKGEAESLIQQVRGQAESKKQIADAEAYAIRIRANAEAEANRAKAQALEGEGGVRLLTMEQIRQWNGTVPQWSMGGNNMLPTLLLNVPAPPSNNQTK